MNKENLIGKGELVRFIADRRGLTLKAAEESVSDVFESIEEILIDHKSVNIPGFGRFISAIGRPKNVYDFVNMRPYVQEGVWEVCFQQSKILRSEVKNGQKAI